MSKLIVLAVLMMSLSVILACSDDDPPTSVAITATSGPTDTLQATPQPTNQIPTPQPTSTPSSSATPTATDTALPTATVTPEGHNSNRAQAIGPLKVDEPEAFLSELSGGERSCLSDNGISHQELTRFAGSAPRGSPETNAAIIDCLHDATVLRLFLISLVGLSEPFSPETSVCIEEGLVPLDLRRILASTDARDASVNSLALGMVALNVSVACMNDDEWDNYAPRLGLPPDFREGAACLFEELGGPEKLAEAMQEASLGEPEDLARALEACGE